MPKQEISGSASLPEKLYLQISLSCFEEALEQLYILRKINKCPDIPTINISYKTIDERFSNAFQKSTEEEIMSREQVSLLTFQKNVAFIEKALKNTFEELLTQGSFESLLNIINVYKISQSDENNLKADTLQKQTELKELYDTLYKENEFYLRKIEECMADIGKIKDEIEDFTVEADIKLKYIKDWQNAKIESTEIFLQRQGQDTMNKIKKTEANISREVRVHEEITALLEEMRRDLERNIDLWKEKYNKDLKELDSKNDILRNDQEKQRAEIRKLNEEYLKRQKQMDEFKEYKIIQEQKRVELERKNKAATKIQAWWRGTMVRKGFGKFRKKKDKKAKKKGSASEKKDKESK